MSSSPVPEELHGLSALNAAELTRHLKKYLDGLGGLVTPADLEIARELIRQARRAEAIELRLVERARQKPA